MDNEYYDPPLLAITPDNTIAHLHETAGSALHDLRSSGVRMHFFDAKGYELVTRLVPGTQVPTLVRGTREADPDLVLSRLSTVLRRLSDMAAEHASELEDLGFPPEFAAAMLPEITGMGLPDALAACFEILGHPNNDVGTPLHNVFAHGVFG